MYQPSLLISFSPGGTGPCGQVQGQPGRGAWGETPRPRPLTGVAGLGPAERPGRKVTALIFTPRRVFSRPLALRTDGQGWGLTRPFRG